MSILFVSCLYPLYHVFILCFMPIFFVSYKYSLYHVYILCIMSIFFVSFQYYLCHVHIHCIMSIFFVSCPYTLYQVHFLFIISIFFVLTGMWRLVDTHCQPPWNPVIERSQIVVPQNWFSDRMSTAYRDLVGARSPRPFHPLSLFRLPLPLFSPWK